MATTYTNPAIIAMQTGKAICIAESVEMDRNFKTTSCTWKMLGFDKSSKLVGYNYQLKSQDLDLACVPQMERFIVPMRTNAPAKPIAKAQWVAGKTPAQCVADALNSAVKGCYFTTTNSVVVTASDGSGFIGEANYFIVGNTFYVTAIY